MEKRQTVNKRRKRKPTADNVMSGACNPLQETVVMPHLLPSFYSKLQ